MNLSSEISSNCTLVSFDYIDEMAATTHERQKYVALAYGIICSVGLVANVLLMTSLLGGGGNRGVTVKTPSTILIINLAIADMLLLLTLPFAIVHRLQQKWIFGNVMCKLEEGIKFLNYYGSVFFITAMAVDRYVCLCRPSTYGRRSARKTLWFLSAAIWFFALVFVVPLMVYTDVDGYGFCTILFPGTQIPNNTSIPPLSYMEEKKTLCLDNFYLLYGNEGDYEYNPGDYPSSWPPNDSNISMTPPSIVGEELAELVPSCRHPPVRSLHIWLICNFVFGFVIPFSIISISYVKIMRLKSTIFSTELQSQSTRSGDPSENGEPSKQQFLPGRRTNGKFGGRIVQQNQKAKMIMGVLVPCLILAFAFCWLPYHTWHLAQINGVSGIDSIHCNLIRDVTFCLAFFNSAINPILNSFFLFNFKERLVRSSSWLKKISVRRISTRKQRKVGLVAKQQDDVQDKNSTHEASFLTTHVSVDAGDSRRLSAANSPV